jgi:FixJ family two-component response regulator
MERFPNLNENEKHLVILLRLKFTSKEIADLRAVSVKAIEISRYRLKKKMNLDDNDSLTSFVQKI